MIDLSTAKVGDKFELRGEQIVTLIKRNKSQLILEDDAGFYLNSVSEGVSTEEPEFNIVSKHDPRHWLKDLPDADLFNLFLSEYIQCDKGGIWFDDKGLLLREDKMPKLTGDEWKESKIFIADLKAWQEQNK